MKILFSSLHQIDHSKGTINEVDITQTSSDLLDYIDKLIKEIIENSNKRRFQFTSDTTEIRTIIDKYLRNEFAIASEANAKRLLRIEAQAQEEISRLQIEIQKGSLFQSYIEYGNSKRIIISKAEHSDFLDDADFLRHAGLPWKKKIFKAFIVEIDDVGNIGRVYVYDTNSTMAKYWWRDYLELSETYTDSYDTKTALDVLDRKIFNPIKREHPADHTILRNSMVKYFRSQTEFDMDDFVNSVFQNYSPVNSAFPLPSLIQKVYDLPERWGFDSKFTIERNEINKRRVNVIHLTDNIDLYLNDYIDRLESIIVSGQEDDGKKFIKIYSDIGYERFRYPEGQ